MGGRDIEGEVVSRGYYIVPMKALWKVTNCGVLLQASIYQILNLVVHSSKIKKNK